MTDAQKIKLTAHVKAQGCSAKISAAQLHEIVQGLPDFAIPELLTTIGSFEDAAVYKLSEQTALLSTLDFFPPLVDDPYIFGQIAAVNALSDIYAMGGRPIFALSILCFPTCDYPLSVAQQIVAGGAHVLKEAGAALAGGHSIQGSEPLYGLAVTGLVPLQKMLTNGGAKVGDAIVLTKKIGTGVLLLAQKGGVLSESAYDELLSSLLSLNGVALNIASRYEVHGATDVTGFGLVGHLHEMGKASKLKARLKMSDIPLFSEAPNLAAQGLVPAASYANLASGKEIAYINDGIDQALVDLLFDPQTSGGLLLAVPDHIASALSGDLERAGLTGAIIGHFVPGEPGQVEVV